MDLDAVNNALVDELRLLHFRRPVTHVYNPLEYARETYDLYLQRYAGSPREVVLLGMNPGPWGMAQTGIPFGEVKAVKEWIGIKAPVGSPAEVHPKRRIEGFNCRRSEVSGKRLWGWVQKTFTTPHNFFSRFFVANYCPLMFIEESGRNRPLNIIRKAEQKPLLAVCDAALRQTIEWFQPRFVVGVGDFAAKRATAALSGFGIPVGRITHPSPANPKANQNWESLVEAELTALGIRF